MSLEMEKNSDEQPARNGSSTFRQRRFVLEFTRRIAWTIVASLRLPVIVLFVLWELKSVGQSQLLASNLAHGLASIMPSWVLAMILYRAISPDGIAGGLLSWPKVICEHLRRALFLVLLIVCPLLAVCESLKQFSAGQYSDSLGRLALMGAMSVMTFVFWRSARAIVKFETQRRDESQRGDEIQRGDETSRATLWLSGGRGFQWFASLVPLSLVCMSAAGYRFAAEQLGMRVLWTLLAGLLVLLCWSLLQYLFGLYEVRMLTSIQGSGSDARQSRIELSGNTRQVLRLLNIAGWVAMLLTITRIWQSTFPSGLFLDQMVLWDGAVGIDGIASKVTYRNLAWAAAVMLVAIGVSRNLVGLIELCLPRRLPLDKGGRFAVSFVTRYVVSLIGLVIAAHQLGFSWDRVQWLAAGLTVGLGFGLQEVFANLVSGIIILLERPVRVGDYVSVNAVSGTVTKMALRATTIVDSDRREWIVPNKKFITDDVMNWTLTDTVSRAVFALAVPHGSDTRLVQQTLLDVARRQSAVLDYPEPSAVLVKIGPRSLDYELRLFLPSRSGFSTFQNNLHVEINDALRQAGVDLSITMGEGVLESVSAAPSVRRAA